MNNITVTCGDIHTSLGFLYVVSFAVVNQSLDDCEQSWFSEVTHTNKHAHTQ